MKTYSQICYPNKVKITVAWKEMLRKDILKGLIVIGMAIMLAMAEAVAMQVKGPRIRFDTIRYHFGQVNEGEILEYAFHFKNAGDGDLIVCQVTSS